MNNILVQYFINSYNGYELVLNNGVILVYCKKCKEKILDTSETHYLPNEYLIEIVIVIHTFMSHDSSNSIQSICGYYVYMFELNKLTILCKECNKIVCSFTLYASSPWTTEFMLLLEHERSHEVFCKKRCRHSGNETNKKIKLIN